MSQGTARRTSLICEERKDQLLLYAAGALEADAETEVRAHLSEGCVNCEAALAEATATLVLLPRAAEPVTPSPGVWRRLEARIGQSAVPIPMNHAVKELGEPK